MWTFNRSLKKNHTMEQFNDLFCIFCCCFAGLLPIYTDACCIQHGHRLKRRLRHSLRTAGPLVSSSNNRLPVTAERYVILVFFVRRHRFTAKRGANSPVSWWHCVSSLHFVLFVSSLFCARWQQADNKPG